MATKDEQEGELQLRDRFSKDGFVCLRQALPTDALNDWQAIFAELWSFLFQKLFDHGHTSFPKDSCLATDTSKTRYALGLGVKNGFREVVMRSPGRYELSLLNHDDWFQEKGGLDLLEQLKSQLDSVVPALLGKSTWNDVHITNLSFVVSTPGASMQGWHADGGHVSLDEHKPCHCFNVFIPLQDMPSMDWGPTELRPGSQYYTRNLAPMLLAAKCRKQLRPTQAPLLQLGDILAFDYRILHRGLANTTKDKNRAVLVLTVCEPWFEDLLNFPKKSLYESAEPNGVDDSMD
eukprot:scaffold3077_cov162-Amphora_coffeaeformis.AAC.23